jgi:hypothetical protein
MGTSRRRALVSAGTAMVLGSTPTMKVSAQPGPGYVDPALPRWKEPIKESGDLQIAAASLSNRIQYDATFKKKLADDPVKTLSSLGIGKDAVRELIREDAYLRNKLGPGLGPLADCAVSCVCSEGCCVSCWVGSGNGKDVNPLTLPAPEFGAKDPGFAVNPRKDLLLKNIMNKGHITPDLK